MKKYMIYILIIIVLVIIAGVYVARRYNATTNDANIVNGTGHFVSSDGTFSFDYPGLGYKITTGPNFIKYEPGRTNLEGPVGAYFSWDEIYEKVAAGYWEEQKVNKNGVKYNLSEDHKSLRFRLAKHGGRVVSFNLALHGGSLRAQEITNTIIDSFKENGTGSKESFEQTKQKVINLAEQELYKHYPDGIRDGKKYELIEAIPSTGSSQWRVIYDLPETFDAKVEIRVDPALKKIINYQDAWS